MGVDRTDYIIYGWKLPRDIYNRNGEKIDLWDDKYLPMIEGRRGEEFCIVRDNMSGEYTLFGIRYHRGGDKWEGWGYTKLDFGQQDPEKVKSRYVELFDNEPPGEPETFIFSCFY